MFLRSAWRSVTSFASVAIITPINTPVWNSLRFVKMASAPVARPPIKNYHHSTRTERFLPPVDRTMTVLDKSFFHKEIPLVAIKLENPAFISNFARSYERFILKQHGVGHVVFLGSEENSGAKGILLAEQYTDAAEAEKQLVPEFSEILKQTPIAFVPYRLQLTYDFWKAEEILAAILPESLLEEIPVGFTIVGHVAHLNIRDQYLPYKFIIGQVVLDKNPRVRTVVNKLDAIDTVFRTFDMEVLAGERDFMVEQSESNCRFRFDFSKVYWNSRLHTEHDRLIRKFRKGEAVCDVFAGVGPFAVPAGKKHVLAFASDLNPESYKYLVSNIELNKVGAFVKPFCEDARTFIRDGVTALLDFEKETPTITIPPKGRVSRSKPEKNNQPEVIKVPRHYSHYVMNLPDTATEFLDSFIGLYNNEEIRQHAFGSTEADAVILPTIHVHCFHKHDPHVPEPSEAEVFEDLRARVSTKLNHEMKADELDIHSVRKVAPTKTMYCISFKLPLEVALTKPADIE
ncbi:uncharacterized protein SAPINGB_P004909 [Magnusiomyces paraingens]|uniref:tRNA (guanine(37)-N1)-methyltransferase n=1 Tax=Magnusiomyces paraingens TaxID=2606893 RepID=A0A5E8C3A2_9ASCO|nr:uncharacterized protein SAPINGB_P004909 [Saprochaete ingens]VVT56238.1 unnamed protein product [Saprochaete ingens]